MTERHEWALLGIAVVALSWATSCAGNDSGQGQANAGPSIVVTTTIWGDLVQQLVGDDATVDVLIAPGLDPHAFEPSAQQAATILGADLVVANGLGLEEGMDELLESAEREGVPVLELAPLLDPILHEDEHREGEGHVEEEEHDHGPEDPHVFHDPVRMADAAVILAGRIAEIDEGLADDAWSARGQELADELLLVHADVGEVLADVAEPCRRLVTSHDSLRYFAMRYGFGVIGTVIPGTSSTAGPSAADFAELAGAIRDAGVPAIFADTSESTRLAETLAREVGEEIAVVTLYTESLGEPGTGAETYPGLARTNAMLVAGALAGCQGG